MSAGPSTPISRWALPAGRSSHGTSTPANYESCSQFRTLPPRSWWAPGDAIICCLCSTSCTGFLCAARRVQDCNSHLPVLVRQCLGLPGRLSAHCRRPCQTTAFCRHWNTCCQLDAAVLETGPLPLQDHKSGTVCLQISDYVVCHTTSSGSYWRHF